MSKPFASKLVWIVSIHEHPSSADIFFGNGCALTKFWVWAKRNNNFKQCVKSSRKILRAAKSSFLVKRGCYAAASKDALRSALTRYDICRADCARYIAWCLVTTSFPLPRALHIITASQFFRFYSRSFSSETRSGQSMWLIGLTSPFSYPHFVNFLFLPPVL